MSQRKAVTKTIATRYARADKATKGVILDELCATTGWHRNHARKALMQALRPTAVRRRTPRSPKYGSDVIAALRFCWAVLGAPAGKRLAAVLPDLVPILRRFGELSIDDATAELLASMSAATIDRRLAEDRRRLDPKGRAHTKPGSLLKSQIPIRTWAQWDDAVPGFVEIDLVGHEGGNAVGDHAYTLTVTDIATGWTENRSVPNKARKWVLAALEEIAGILPFPIRGVDSDNGSEFINHHLLAWCAQRQITFTRSRPGNSNDGAHVEQKNWAIVRTVVGYHRYDTSAELLVLNGIWVLQSSLSNFFCPQQKLISKVRDGAKVTKKYDTATTPHRRVERHDAVTAEDKAILAGTYVTLNPAAIQRQIQALTAELLTLTTAKAGPGRTPIVEPSSTRASLNESTKRTSRAS
ncbi:integrase catalytic domain-containing protein [Rhodococcus ruber]|uniref:DDE-type integrase/transposase/recombinase n=1 Tax=Rhodococcus ruber TaxID=1830 RepID=UPI000362A3C1